MIPEAGFQPGFPAYQVEKKASSLFLGGQKTRQDGGLGFQNLIERILFRMNPSPTLCIPKTYIYVYNFFVLPRAAVAAVMCARQPDSLPGLAVRVGLDPHSGHRVQVPTRQHRVVLAIERHNVRGDGEDLRVLAR